MFRLCKRRAIINFLPQETLVWGHWCHPMSSRTSQILLKSSTFRISTSLPEVVESSYQLPDRWAAELTGNCQNLVFWGSETSNRADTNRFPLAPLLQRGKDPNGRAARGDSTARPSDPLRGLLLFSQQLQQGSQGELWSSARYSWGSLPPGHMERMQICFWAVKVLNSPSKTRRWYTQEPIIILLNLGFWGCKSLFQF